MAASFHTNFETVQWVVLAYLIAMTATMVFAGRIGDRIGRRRLLLVGLALLIAASAAGSAAPSLPLLVVARAVQGAGAAIALSLAIAFVGETVPKQEMGRAMGLLGSTSALGTALGPSLGGVLVQAFGWRSIFLINLPLGLAAAVMAHRYLPSARPTMERASDLRGHVVALFAPLRDVRLRSSLIANLLVSAVMMATLVVGPFYLSHALGLDAAAVGAVMSVGPIAAALMGAPAGRLADRFGARPMVLAGLGGIAGGAALLALLPQSLGVAGYVASIVAITTSYAIFQAANNTEVMRDVEPGRRGVVSSTLNLSRNLGLIGGTSLMGAVFVAAGMHATFALGAALMVAALAIVGVRVALPTRGWWTRPALLIALSAVPLLFGVVRLVRMSSGASPTPEDARFIAAPVPVVAHIIAAMLFSVVGAFQFASEVRRRWPRWHRVAGRVVFAAGIAVAVSGLWMTVFYKFPEGLQGPLLFTVRLLVGVGMLAALVLALTSILRRDVPKHSAWMMRAYALGLGAGTQAVLMLPWTLAFGIPKYLPYELLMTLAWLINLGVAESIIRRSAPRPVNRGCALTKGLAPSGTSA